MQPKPRSSRAHALENTGRLLHGPAPLARRILFGANVDESIATQLRFITDIDKAHLIMLAESGLIEKSSVSQIIREINDLRQSSFAPLRDQTTPRGLYLLYENYLIEKLGAQVGGRLQTARSRNDLNATILRMRLREPLLELLREALRLQAVVLRRSRRYAAVTMPVYTHYQPAVPITYGHYLAGVGFALNRDIAGLMSVIDDLNRCPLGAGAGGGTSLRIDPVRTASLLGFEKPVPHSVDAVASRDLILRLLSSAAILGVTLSRVASDLLLWTTGEFGFLTVPDTLAGSSSMMPQKRNVYMLEHVQGRSAAALGAFVHSASAMRGCPFTNSVAVGTEAVSPVWDAMKATSEATILLRLIISGASPQSEAMLDSARKGYTSATELANRLVVEGGAPFRAAHKSVGSLIRAAIEDGSGGLENAVIDWKKQNSLTVSVEGLDPASVAQAAVYGGGPARASLAVGLELLCSDWASWIRTTRQQAQRWRDSEISLSKTALDFCGPD